MNLPALGLVVLVHLGFALIALKATFELAPAVRKAPLIVQSIKLEPPPPPSEPETVPADLKPAIQVPKPLLHLPAPDRPVIIAVPEPSLVQALAAEAPRKSDPAPGAVASPPVSAGDLSSSMIHAPPPRYPYQSRRLREEGTVVLLVLLGIDGTVASIEIAQSSGHARLDEAARKAVRKWRWSPTVRDGMPVQVRGTVEIPFVLNG